MFWSYYKIALRNLWKHKLLTVINIFGFAAGLVVCFLAIAHIKAVFEYDTFHPKRDRIYRIITDVTSSANGPMAFATSPLCLASTLKKDYSIIDEAARVVNLSTSLTGNDKRLDVIALAVDPGFFSLFNFQLANGKPATELLTAVITPQTAARYFGPINPVGKVLRHETLGLITITGVLAPVPVNTHFKFDLLLSLTSLQQGSPQTSYQEWQRYTNGYTYVLLKSSAATNHLQAVLFSLIKRLNQGLHAAHRIQYGFRSQPLSRISPSTELLNRRMMNEKDYTELLADFFVGLVTLLLAGFNYVNLTLTRSFGRAREVGVRKAVGALRWQIMSQFITESVVIALLAFVLACGMAVIIRPLPVVQLWFLSNQTWDLSVWLLLIGFTLTAGVLAGFVPARILAGFEPAQVFRSYSGLRVIRGLTFRKALIVAQFTISFIVMIVLVTISRQFHFFSTADYGFRRERLLTIPLRNHAQQRLVNELRQVAGVERVMATSELLNELNEFRYVKNEQHGGDSVRIASVAVDSNFVPTMELSLLAGQNFPHTTGVVPHQHSARFILLNEEAVRAFGLGSLGEAIGRSLWIDDSTEVQIAGVLKNFRFSTLAQPIKPLMMVYQPDRFRIIHVTVSEGSQQTALAETRRIWKRLLPYEPFTGEWYDEYLYSKYNRSEYTDFFILLIGLSLSIACLGLLGMVTYTTQMRTKEISIRKVMGATVLQLFNVLSWDFVKLLLLAFLIAYPLGFMAGTAILSNFAYRVSIGYETFGGCLGLLFLLGILTIGLRTYRAAQANPTKVLRTE